MAMVILSAAVQRFSASHMRDFYIETPSDRRKFYPWILFPKTCLDFSKHLRENSESLGICPKLCESFDKVYNKFSLWTFLWKLLIKFQHYMELRYNILEN